MPEFSAKPAPLEGESALSAKVGAVSSELEQSIVDGSAYEALGEEAIQRLLTAATKIYVGKLERSGHFPPFRSDDTLIVTPTEAAATASEMLKALQIEVFELGMWQTRGGL